MLHLNLVPQGPQPSARTWAHAQGTGGDPAAERLRKAPDFAFADHHTTAQFWISPSCRKERSPQISEVSRLTCHLRIAYNRIGPQSGVDRRDLNGFRSIRSAGGKILLYEQPESPWRLPGRLKHADVYRLERSGAIITAQSGLRMTLVEWPDNSLKRFMLEEVLLHELGHHILQHHKGKRPARIARTKDHEASAERFAIRQRSLLRDAKRIPNDPSRYADRRQH